MAFDVSTYKSSYFFVPVPKRNSYDLENKIERYRGYIDIRIICKTKIHIGSGYRDFKDYDSKDLVQETMRMNGKLIIPGSSLKGAVRGIARAVSSSCNPERACKPSKKNNYDKCITCDIFGAMGWGSKVIFSDFVAESETETCMEELNFQYGPHINEDDDGNQAYKFYMTRPNEYDGNKKCKVELIPEGTTFRGKLFINSLTEEELCLLMYSLSLKKAKGKGINLKIGGFRNEGIGEVKAECIEFKLNKKLNKKPEELAELYQKCSTSIEDNINDIEYYMWDGDK